MISGKVESSRCIDLLTFLHVRESLVKMLEQEAECLQSCSRDLQDDILNTSLIMEK